MPGARSARPIRLGVVTEQAPPWAGVVQQWQEPERLEVLRAASRELFPTLRRT